jgi:DNA invertase Pin-like site-specific DNA recombinase
LTGRIKSFGKSSNRADGPFPAAAYVRMSTDLQQFSTENQLDRIRRYAEQRGYKIIRVFEDSGRSGLNIDDRDGLNSLMLEVQSGTADFQAILVYDVSRWGRFEQFNAM